MNQNKQGAPTEEEFVDYVASVEVAEKSFSDNQNSETILSDLRFTVRPNEFLGILGPSGCGKTTLLRLIAGLDTEYDGHVLVNGQPVRGPGPNRGIMFQESRLLPWLKVAKNVAFALPSGISKQERNQKVTAALERVGLGDDGRAWPHQLSGGMMKRVALARAIVNVPDFLLLDEPLTALDEPSKYALQDEIAKVHIEAEDMTVVLVTHDVEEAVYLSDRILILSRRPSRVIAEINVPLERPRKRTSEEFMKVCADVTKTIFENWWQNGQAKNGNVANE